MELPTLPKPSQKLNQEVVQALHMLQLPLHELNFYLQEQAEANPVLQVLPPKQPLCIQKPQEEFDLSWGDPALSSYEDTWHQEELRGWSQEGPPPLPQLYKSNPKSFTQQLVAQLRQAPQIPPDFLPHCIFFAESLDSRGYFVDDLDQMAQILQISEKEAQQVLRLVQEMRPTGVGARSLQECLLLQLAKSGDFNKDTLCLIAQDPKDFQPVNFKWMADLLGTSIHQAQATWQKVQGLQPIPSAVGSQRPSYLIPEAVLRIHQGRPKVEHHLDSWCQVSLRLEEDLPQSGKKKRGNTSILQSYQKENEKNAQSIRKGLAQRKYILDSIISFMVAYQQDYFLQKEKPLKPLGMGEIATFLQLHPTWVSRALCDKYLLTPQGVLPLKALLSQADPSPEVVEDRDVICQRLEMLIEGEDKTAPLSDARLQVLLEGFHIHIARRTVVKYRGLLGIPSTPQRRIRPGSQEK